MVSVIIRNLTKRFGDTVALSGVTLRIEPGELFFLLGPSGCGKTTLLRHIAGFHTPDQGHLFFDAREVTRLPPHQRSCAMMFQSYALWPHLTVEENVAFGLVERKMPRGEIGTRVEEALELVRMGEHGGRKINQLSGGQQQRVALARALVVRPDCLLLDEPLSNLDTKLRIEMRAEIRRICKQFGLTAVYVTHDQKEALSMGDRMAVMEKGVLSQVGTPLEIYRQPRTTSVAGFIGETNFLPAEIECETSRRGIWAVSTTHGRFWGRVTDLAYRPQPGDLVQLCLRPESLRLVETPERMNTLTGKLADAVYLGETAQYVIEDDRGRRFRLCEMNPDGLRGGLDETNHACILPEDVMILRR
ncbi:MAG: ABC transporter ATP-binding protein [Verrucomicrobiales bacterium]|nr:ABC transporter ATP-binding protein [Verrucomicrobiales bacterium]